MIKVKCDACGAPYEVDPRRIPKTGLKMRCPACGASVHVHPPSAVAPTEPGLPPARVPQPLSGAHAPGRLPNMDLELDLPALKGSPGKPAAHPGIAAFGPGFESTDLTDLPAVKGSQPARTAPASKLAPSFGELDSD